MALRTATTGPLEGLRRPVLAALGGCAGLSCAVNLLYLTSPLYMMQVLDRVLASGNLDTLLYLTLIALLATVTLAAIDAARGQAAAGLGTWLERAIGARALAAADPAAGLADARAVAGLVRGPGAMALLDLPWSVLFLGVMWLLHPLLALLTLAGLAGLVALTVVGELVERRGQQAEHAARQAVAAIARSLEHEAALTRAMGIGEHLRARALAAFDTALAAERRTRARHGLLTGLGKLIRHALQLAVLGTGALLVLRHDASSGAMIAGSILLGRALAPVDQILGAWRGIIDARAALARLQATAMAPPPPGFAAPPIAPMTLSLASVVVPAGPGRRPLLDRLSLTLEPGSCLGVLGPSGAGKSTLCRLLAGGVAASFGEVRLGGVALGHLTAEQRRRLIGYLPQEPTLFPGTVAENIARMATAPDPAAVSDAARLAGAHELILQLPDGYATRLGFQGAPLSGGERQRLALARALLGRPPLVVLDEPNAALDQAGEAALMDTLAALKAQGHLVVAVAHRAAFLSVADRLLVLEQGRAADFGGHDEVLGRLALRRRELRLDSSLAQGARIGAWLDLQLAAPELGGVRQALEVALVEIFAHRVRRGFDGRPGQPILMRLSRDAGSVTCLVGDHGRPVGPHEIEESARALEFDPSAIASLPEQGLELGIARAAVDAMWAERQGLGNRITLRKQVGPVALRRERAA